MIDLSVLICSTHNRYRTFGPRIQDQVWGQYQALPPEDQERIEILFLSDNKKMVLGTKRNSMVSIAQGRYVQFIDDDDRIASDMFSSVLEAIKGDPDVVTFLAEVTINGKQPPKICEYSTRFEDDANLEGHYERLPNHLCAVRRELAVWGYPDLPYGEDSGYARRLLPALVKEAHIPRVLYYYDYNEQTSEAPNPHRAPAFRVKAVPALVDVVMLSKAATPALRAMTQNAINTALAGAGGLSLNVMVMEQQPGVRYEHARTVFAGDEFNYNRFVNRGIQLGFAPWILVANNDLIFHDGWLHSLLAIDEDVVSPKCPRDRRQAHITEPTAGYQLAEHWSSWCYLMRRKLWYRLGGLNEDCTFWCCDDSVLEQLKAIDVAPVLVPDSVVEHLLSQTLKTTTDEEYADFTWRNVALFNEKYGTDKFVGDTRYGAWLQQEKIRTIVAKMD